MTILLLVCICGIIELFGFPIAATATASEKWQVVPLWRIKKIMKVNRAKPKASKPKTV